ncbi:MAG: hypothetical protein IJW47_04545, partial [Clostridia bacterium]|nr:hypothetical protein [Clostridia bacterium]
MRKLLMLLLVLCLSLATASMLTGCECKHEWELKDIEKATCVVAGVENYECKLCGEKKTEELPVDENAHNFDGENCLGCNVNVWDYALNHVKSQTNFTEGTNYTVSYYVDNELYGTVMASDNTMYFKEKAEVWWIYEDNIIKMYTYNDGQWQYEELNDEGQVGISIEYIIAETMIMDYVYDKEKDLFVNEENGVNVTISNGKFVSFVTVDGGNGYFFEFGNTVIEDPELKKQQEKEKEELEKAKAKWIEELNKYKEFAKTQIEFTEGTNFTVTVQITDENYSHISITSRNGIAWQNQMNFLEDYSYVIKTENGYLYHGKPYGDNEKSTYYMNEQQKEEFGINEGESALSYYIKWLDSATFVEYLGNDIYVVDVENENLNGRFKVDISNGKLNSIDNIGEETDNTIIYTFTYGDAEIDVDAVLSLYENVTAFSEFAKTQNSFTEGTNYSILKEDNRNSDNGEISIEKFTKDGIYREENYDAYKCETWIIKDNDNYKEIKIINGNRYESVLQPNQTSYLSENYLYELALIIEMATLVEKVSDDA